MAGETVKQCGMARNGCAVVCGRGKHLVFEHDVRPRNRRSRSADVLDGLERVRVHVVLLPRLCGLLG